MDVRNCRKCGKLYNYTGAPAICPACKEEVEKKFLEVKHYIMDHKGCSVSDVAEACEISTQQIKQWLRDERLEFSAESGELLTCENCDAPIRTGRFCEKCKQEMANEFKGSIRREEKPKPQPEKETKENPRMRFLDH